MNALTKRQMCKQPVSSSFETAFLKCNLHTLQFTHLKCKIKCFLVYLQSCATIPTISFRIFLYPQKKPHAHCQSPPHFPPVPSSPRQQ